METRTEDREPTGRPTLASSWDAAGGVLTQSLLLVRAGVGTRDPDWEALLAPPAPGQELVRLQRSAGGGEDSPCLLYLMCDPDAAEEVAAVGILSSARNMEVYSCQEYCGTSRGRSVGAALNGSEQEITFYKKYLKLEPPTRACKIKLLSFGEEPCVLVGKVVVHVRSASPSSSTSSPALGCRVDLDKIQTMMESMGSKLSPGAQQLMNLVRFQQQNRIPVAEQLESVLRHTGYKHLIAQQSPATTGATERASSTPLPIRTGLTLGNPTEGSEVSSEQSPQAPGGESTTLDRCRIGPQNHSRLEAELRDTISSVLPKKTRDDASMLPFLQNLCSQVSRLRVSHGTERLESSPKPQEAIAAVGMETQPVCSYLEKILSKNLELMEKKLMDHIDERLLRLQEQLDRKLAVVMELLQGPHSPPAELPLRHCDSGERLSNGER
ncbi:ATPase PAAT isoform X2 [Ochotona curzoniae]|uniref:ATPase PAAT isoform X2 n=1 Tax=Ochotona curzoniae TaxID=130825 RepID=UPI001B34660D|nr:ATPase PAAT isoform X2 [Ochotona curzoniae]